MMDQPTIRVCLASAAFILACGAPEPEAPAPVALTAGGGEAPPTLEQRQCPDPGDGSDAVLGADTPENRRADRALEEANTASEPAGLEAALASLRADVGEESAHPWTAYAEGWILERLERFDEAAKAYERAVAAHSHFDRAHLALGGLHNQAGHRREAAASYQRAVEANPGMMLAWYNLAQVHYLEGEHEDALFEWQCALAIEPDDFRTQTKVVQALHALDRYAEALEARAAIRARWEAGAIPRETRAMVIDQFEVAGHRVYVEEIFHQPPDDLHYIYSFLVTKNGRVLRTVQLETSPGLAFGGVDSLMGMNEGGTHSQLGVAFEERPNYQTLEPVARELIEDIQAGRARATISSSTSGP